MAITKKIRFEVFKRDGFQCAYCGKAPPEVILEIDHIEPKSKKGKDDMINLLTACFDCNRGKTSIPLDKIPTRLSENIEILKIKEGQLKEYRKYVKKVEQRIVDDIETIDIIYSTCFHGYSLSNKFKVVSLKTFLKHLPLHEITAAMEKACYKFEKPNDWSNREDAIKYFCGICWRKIKGGT